MPDANGILITRPEPRASETAARLATLGFQPVIAPLLEVRTQCPELPAPELLQAVLVTSANAIAGLPDSYRPTRLLVVGDATAARARAEGFSNVESATGDAEALAGLAIRTCDPFGPPLLLAVGKGHGQDLAGILTSRGFRVQRRITYAAVRASELPATARDALRSGVVGAALFFSAKTARAFIILLRRARLNETVRSVDALAIGQPCAMALQALPWRRIFVAERPNQDAMLALLR